MDKAGHLDQRVVTFARSQIALLVERRASLITGAVTGKFGMASARGVA